MVAALIALCGVLTALTVLNLILCFAIIRRLRETADAHSHTAEGATTVADNTLPRVGSAVGPFRAETLDGATLDDDELAQRPTLVAFLLPGCEPCEGVAARLLDPDASLPSRLVVFVAGGPQDEESLLYVRQFAPVGTVAVVPASGEATNAFGGITGFPTVLRVDGGVITAAGRRLEDVIQAADGELTHQGVAA